MPVAAVAKSSSNANTRANRIALRICCATIKNKASMPMLRTHATVGGNFPGPPPKPRGLRNARDPEGLTVTLTLRVAEALPFGGTLTGLGLKLQFTPAGAPAQARVSDPATTFVELSERLKLAA